MSAWALVPKAWYSWDFSVTAGDRTIARFDLSSWRERGVITIDGIEHRVFRESVMGDFVIERGSSTLARATKQSAFTSTVIFKYDGREYMLRKQRGGGVPSCCWTATGRSDRLRRRACTRRAAVDFPRNGRCRSGVHHLAHDHSVEARGERSVERLNRPDLRPLSRACLMIASM